MKTEPSKNDLGVALYVLWAQAKYKRTMGRQSEDQKSREQFDAQADALLRVANWIQAKR